MNIITEEQLEQLCIDWFVELGYDTKMVMILHQKVIILKEMILEKLFWKIA